MGLQQFERRLERLVEGVFAKAFKGGIQPVEVARRLTRAMDTERVVGARETLVPNHFVVLLHPVDHERFQSLEKTLTNDLAEGVREHARDEGYRFAGAVHVAFESDDTLSPGTFVVRSEVRESPGGRPLTLILSDGTRIDLAEEPIVIGRHPECAVVLTDPAVSTRHAEVLRRGTGALVRDLGSTNGTKVNGRGIKELELTDGDELMLGTTTLRFEA